MHELHLKVIEGKWVCILRFPLGKWKRGCM